jgi:nucleoside-diphosphate-sugar epimerase
MRLAITGANGFVGSRLVADFAADGDEIVAAARRPLAGLPPGAAWRQAPDLGPDAAWRDVVRGCDLVVHAAARVHVMKDASEDPLAAYRRANVEGTLALARQSAEAGVRRFLFISSIKVNGESTGPGRPFRADDPPAPVDPYGVSKAEAEAALFALGRETGMEVVVVRPVLVYGPGVRANFAAMLKAVARGLPLPLGGIRNRRSLLFVGNLSDLVRRAAVHPATAGQIFLASDGEDLSTAEMLKRLGTAVGRRARLLPVPPALLRAAATMLGKQAQAQRLLGSLQVDIGPARELLGWSPPFTVDAGFAETAASFRRAPAP